MAAELIALIEGQEVGRVSQRKNGLLGFTYNESWRQAEDAYPISLSMPLAAREHGHDPVHAYLAGLLPDNERVLDAWARRFGVSARNPFGLLTNVGEDCAGAVQLVRAERVDAIREGGDSGVEWLSEHQVAERLRMLRRDHAAWRRPGDKGQFSLAGAQPKTALLLEAGRWGVPSGRTPTTHILKPPIGEFDGFIENEHLCLELAVELGLAAARSRVARFEDEVAIVIERYDRVRSFGHLTRIHQEDLCQALAVPPTRKYENEGGPGVEPIVELLRSNSRAPDEDIAAFLDALVLSWLTAATDAHAKNFSILIGAGGGVRLAPLYDLVSALPYPSLSDYRIKLAMRIGGEYLVRKVGARQWQKLARQLRLDPERIRARATDLAERTPDLIRDVRMRAERNGLTDRILDQLQDAVTARAEACRDELRSAGVEAHAED